MGRPDRQDGDATAISFDADTVAIIAFIAIAMYNILELSIIIFTTFRRRRGLYFISFCVATWSIPLNALAALLKYSVIPSIVALNNFVATISFISWSGIVTGQSLVLYSRLHLVDRNRAHLRAVLSMIIINAAALHTTGGIFIFLYFSPNPDRFAAANQAYEKVQISIFFAQELIISGLYIVATVWMFRSTPEGGSLPLRGRRPAKVLRKLIVINIIIILLDVTILALEFAGFYDLQTTWKLLVYSVKLKLEFRILNSLVDVARAGRLGGSSSSRRDYFAGVRSGNGQESRGPNQQRMDHHEATNPTEVFDGSMVSEVRGNRELATPAYSASIEIGATEDVESRCGCSLDVELSHGGIMVSSTTEVKTTPVMHTEQRTCKTGPRASKIVGNTSE